MTVFRPCAMSLSAEFHSLLLGRIPDGWGFCFPQRERWSSRDVVTVISHLIQHGLWQTSRCPSSSRVWPSCPVISQLTQHGCDRLPQCWSSSLVCHQAVQLSLMWLSVALTDFMVPIIITCVSPSCPVISHVTQRGFDGLHGAHHQHLCVTNLHTIVFQLPCLGSFWQASVTLCARSPLWAITMATKEQIFRPLLNAIWKFVD